MTSYLPMCRGNTMSADASCRAPLPIGLCWAGTGSITSNRQVLRSRSNAGVCRCSGQHFERTAWKNCPGHDVRPTPTSVKPTNSGHLFTDRISSGLSWGGHCPPSYLGGEAHLAAFDAVSHTAVLAWPVLSRPATPFTSNPGLGTITALATVTIH